MKPPRFRWLLVLSLPFLLLALHRADYLTIPTIVSPVLLVGSFALLVIGFLLHAASWWAVVNAAGCRVAWRDCLAGTGLSVFAKYVPGKLLAVIGRALYLSERSEHPAGKLSVLSFQTQLIALWAGLTLGAAALAGLDRQPVWKWIAVGSWVILTLVVFTGLAHGATEVATRRILRRDVRIPQLELGSTLHVLPWFLGLWACWAAGFQLLAGALGAETSVRVGLAFPLAAVLGIAAVFAPGGLGVREGVLTGVLTLGGLDLTTATTLSIVSRLWFLVGEASSFGIGWIAGHRRPQ